MGAYVGNQWVSTAPQTSVVHQDSYGGYSPGTVGSGSGGGGSAGAAGTPGAGGGAGGDANAAALMNQWVNSGGSSGGGGGGGSSGAYKGPGYQVNPINHEEYINKMYDANLTSQKEQLKTNYEKNMSDLEQTGIEGQQSTDAALTKTYVDAAKQAKNYAEMQNAYGLTSGAMAQAQVAHNNAVQSNLTVLREAQRNAEEQLARQRNMLSQQYSAEIAKAVADNDMNRANALYQAAKDEESRQLEMRKELAQLMMRATDYGPVQEMYGLTDQQAELLRKKKVM